MNKSSKSLKLEFLFVDWFELGDIGGVPKLNKLLLVFIDIPGVVAPNGVFVAGFVGELNCVWLDFNTFMGMFGFAVLAPFEYGDKLSKFMSTDVPNASHKLFF